GANELRGRVQPSGLLAWGIEAVTDPAHAADARRRYPELLAQPLHVRVDGARRDLSLVAPDVAQARLARLHARAPVEKRAKQPEFERGEVHVAAMDEHAVRATVDRDPCSGLRCRHPR